MTNTQQQQERTRIASPLLLFHICGAPIWLHEREEDTHGIMMIPPKGRGSHWRSEPHTTRTTRQHYYDGRQWFGNPTEIRECPQCHFRLCKDLLFTEPIESVLAKQTQQLLEVLRQIGDKSTINTRAEEEEEQGTRFWDASVPFGRLIRDLDEEVHWALEARAARYRQSCVDEGISHNLPISE